MFRSAPEDTSLILATGTFEYVATIPEHAGTDFQCSARLLYGSDSHQPPHTRLVGLSPQIEFTDAGPTPNPDLLHPATERSCVRLVAVDREFASVAETRFMLDRGLVSKLRAGDVLHLARTGCGRVGVSVVRDEQLIVAVGAISAVPLGKDFGARIPHKLVAQAEEVFRSVDEGFQMHELPVELRIEGERRILYRSRLVLRGFEIWVLHGYYRGIPGTNECVSVVRKGSCSIVDANCSALFLDTSDIEMVQW